MKSIFYLVCPNGQGHIKRSVTIANSLMTLKPDWRFSWFLSEKNREFFNKNANPSLVSSSKVITFPNHYSILLKNAENPDFYSNYTDWINAFKDIPEFKNADLVVSDNIAAPISHHPNLVLVGSFLWTEVLPKAQTTIKVIEAEKASLNHRRVPMMHIENMGMSDVTNLTSPSPIPWVTERTDIKPNRKGILVTCGRSGSEIGKFATLAKQLRSKGVHTIYVDSAIAAYDPDLSPNLFEFTSEAFQKLELIVCRPGIGILTEAVTYTIPLVTDIVQENDEMKFNSERLVDLQIGKQLPFKGLEEFSLGLNEMLQDAQYEVYMNNLQQLETEGAAVASNYIIEQLT